MNVASLALVTLLGWLPDTDPAALVERLGAVRYAEREQAAAALLELGPAALEALREGRHARDAEVRTRAAALLERVQGQLMVRPTMVALDFRDQPLVDVARALGIRAQTRLILQPENEALWKNDRVTLESPEPVPFWTALDRLCAEGHLQHEPNGRWTTPAGAGPTVNLVRGAGAVVPSSISGPLRVDLVNIVLNRTINFQNAPNLAAGRLPNAGGLRLPARGAGAVNDQFNVQLQVVAEPRLLIAQAGQLTLAEATDDRGRSLLPPSSGDGPNRVVHHNIQLMAGAGAAPSLQLHAPLAYPEPRGVRIATLRGSIPVAVATRRPDPLIVPLAGATGKTFRCEGATLIVHDLKPDPNGQGTVLDITLREQSGTGAGTNGGIEVLAHRQGQNPQSQLDILDAQGRPLTFYARPGGGPIGGGAGESRLSLILLNPGEAGAPAQLRYYELARAATEAVFEFHDLPMP